MSFGRRVRAWFRGESGRGHARDRSSSGAPGGNQDLEEFARTRRGVEALVEPRTTMYKMTLLLVADDGEYLRRQVSDLAAATTLCRKLNVPVYDASKVGYPKRMRDYERGERPGRIDLEDLPPWPGDRAGQEGPEDPTEDPPPSPGPG